MSFKRLAPSAVLAVGVTTLITLGMAGMIKQEFTSQDKAESLTLEINPVVEDPIIIDETEIELEIKHVETPPPPPTIERTDPTLPSEPIASNIGAIPTFDPIVIDQGPIVITAADGDVQPLVRIPPIMPPRADRSGHCKVRFNVSAEGAPYDVTTTYCSQSLFERATVKSVSKWKYTPKIVNGRPVAMIGVENIVRYQLTDERGNAIPE